MKKRLAVRRAQASFDLIKGKDFLSVAKKYGVSPRTLLAWREYEYAKWENDFGGEGSRRPGPSDDYQGKWPSKNRELEEYAALGLDPARFADEDLRTRYSKYLQRKFLETRRQKTTPSLPPGKVSSSASTMRLVASSIPGEVERHEAIQLLNERAVLTRTVCRELLESNENYGRRPLAALGLLRDWIAVRFPTSSEPHAKDGIDSMLVPEDYQQMLQEIRDGIQVCEALFMLTTADNRSDEESDEKAIRSELDAYWKKY